MKGARLTKEFAFFLKYIWKIIRSAVIIAEDFTFSDFEDIFFGKKELHAKNSFISLFKEYIANLKEEDRLGTASSYNTTLNSLLEIKHCHQLLALGFE